MRKTVGSALSCDIIPATRGAISAIFRARAGSTRRIAGESAGNRSIGRTYAAALKAAGWF